MSLFNWRMEDILTCFAILVRYSVLFSILPFIGDKMIPMPLKILFSLFISIFLFPVLTSSGLILPSEALKWGATAGGIASTVGLEVLFALVLGFSSKLIFEGIDFGSNLIGNFMGFGAATIYDPHQESQSQLISHFHMTIAMLVFLTLDGHHLLLSTAIESYKVVGLGRASVSHDFGQKMIEMTSEIFILGIKIAAPVGVSIFSVNIIFGMISKAMPQMNIFVLSLTVSALIGFLIIFSTLSSLHALLAEFFSEIHHWMNNSMLMLRGNR